MQFELLMPQSLISKAVENFIGEIGQLVLCEFYAKCKS